MTLQEIQAKSNEFHAAAGEVIDRENAIEAVLVEVGSAIDAGMLKIQQLRGQQVNPSALKR